MNIYIELTEQFNSEKLRAVISSGQAVVLHRVAIMSKDGDWILREDEETMLYVLNVLSGYGARYRYCAPLDIRWMRGGWSSHFEFKHQQFRVRTDFVTRPPRISEKELMSIWKEQEGRNIPFVDLKNLAELKKTNREKDYAVIGELARLMEDPRDQLLYSRSARDLVDRAKRYPDLVIELRSRRPVLTKLDEEIEIIEKELDAERRALMHANERRLEIFLKTAEKWATAWSSVEKEISGLPLCDAHALLVRHAEKLLPFYPAEEHNQ
ncbi:MAG: hypothetical protein A2161_11205 [Candidatus Schekmanbacteria bacterium RBG_13_48_7]|uniref:Uncharacterized protein n=1 Tax=Candidatus Schekmanbacteria bacterium RBG_13_48_7 TaxID=1817878 RepID=A0A1F7S6H4_9BACT|nr:MAG: hypothetical protein A2161_11205 [Candidatus Schekmanbacteria bacterium RBG_13_48_7]